MAGSDDETTPPGWYRQKDDPGLLRWWDGNDWTDDSMPFPDDPARTARGGPSTTTGEVPVTPATPTTPVRAAAGPRPTIRIDDEAPRQRPRPPEPRPARPPGTGNRSRAAQASGRGRGSVRPAPPPGDDRPRTGNWPQDLLAAEQQLTRSSSSSPSSPSAPRSGSPTRVRRPVPVPGAATPARATRPPLSAASHRVVEHGTDRGPALAQVALRAGIVLVVLLVGFLGYTKIRDAAPGDARTLTAKPTPATKEPATATPLPKVVLSLGDLPAGWATQPFDAATDDICLGRIPRAVLVPVQLQSASFTKGAAGPFITNVVARFANETVAKQFMDLTAQAVDSCRSYVDNGSTIHLGPLSFPEFGDETFAAKATGSSPYGALDGDIVYVRSGDRVASIQTISFGSEGISNELVAFLTRLLAHRL